MDQSNSKLNLKELAYGVKEVINIFFNILNKQNHAAVVTDITQEKNANNFDRTLSVGTTFNNQQKQHHELLTNSGCH